MVTVHIPADSEIGRLLREAEEAGEPLRIDTGEATYVVRPEKLGPSGEQHETRRGYDPEQLRAALRTSTGMLSEADAEALKRYIYEAREAGTRGLDRP